MKYFLLPAEEFRPSFSLHRPPQAGAAPETRENAPWGLTEEYRRQREASPGAGVRGLAPDAPSAACAIPYDPSKWWELPFPEQQRCAEATAVLSPSPP